MKACSKCKTDYPEPLEDHFSKRGGRESGLQSWCKKCLAIKRKTSYNNNKIYYKEKARKHNDIYDKRNAQFMMNYLKAHPCIDCGETDPVVLEFDHRGEKSYNVSEMHTYSLKRLEEEVAKCDVRCANCHRRKTAKEFDWYKYL